MIGMARNSNRYSLHYRELSVKHLEVMVWGPFSDVTGLGDFHMSYMNKCCNKTVNVKILKILLHFKLY